jgi:hypothetical protein
VIRGLAIRAGAADGEIAVNPAALPAQQLVEKLAPVIKHPLL